MFDGFDEKRLLAMSAQEKRWLDNVKKAFAEADAAMERGEPEDRCLEELFKAVDTAKTLRRSLRGEDVSPIENKKRFIHFLGLEIPAAQPGSSQFELQETESGQLRKFTLGEIIYSVRCKIHENENLNVAENVDYHILIDWSVRHPAYFAGVKDGVAIFNGFFIWNRLREVLAKFITGIDAMVAFAEGRPFSIGIRPKLGSIQPERRSR